jgi:hypothetical protein
MEYSETTQEVQSMPFSQILEAIAKGVEARLVRTVIVKVATVETMFIARKLHIPEEEIQKWRSLKYYRSESADQTDCPFLQSMGERK